jgi:hypothetical protein
VYTSLNNGTLLSDVQACLNTAWDSPTHAKLEFLAAIIAARKTSPFRKIPGTIPASGGGLGAAFNGLKENLKEGVRNAGASGARITEVILNPNGGVGVLSPSGVVTVVSGAVSVAAEAAVEIAVVGQSSVSALTGLTSVAGLPTAMHMAKGKGPGRQTMNESVHELHNGPSRQKLHSGPYDHRIKGYWDAKEAIYNNDTYHARNASSVKAAAPKDPIKALNESVYMKDPIPGETKLPDRIYYDPNRKMVAVFKHENSHINGKPVFHGYEVDLKAIKNENQYNSLKNFLVKKYGIKVK